MNLRLWAEFVNNWLARTLDARGMDLAEPNAGGVACEKPGQTLLCFWESGLV